MAIRRSPDSIFAEDDGTGGMGGGDLGLGLDNAPIDYLDLGDEGLDLLTPGGSPESPQPSTWDRVKSGYRTLTEPLGVPFDYLNRAAGALYGDTFGELERGKEIPQITSTYLDPVVGGPLNMAGSVANRLIGADVFPSVQGQRAKLKEQVDAARTDHPLIANAVDTLHGVSEGAGEKAGQILFDPVNYLLPSGGKVAKAIGATMLPGVVGGAYEGGREAIARGRAGDYGGAAKAGVGSAVDSLFATMIASHLMSPAAEGAETNRLQKRTEAATTGSGDLMRRGLDMMVEDGEIDPQDAAAAFTSHIDQLTGEDKVRERIQQKQAQARAQAEAQAPAAISAADELTLPQAQAPTAPGSAPQPLNFDTGSEPPVVTLDDANGATAPVAGVSEAAPPAPPVDQAGAGATPPPPAAAPPAQPEQPGLNAGVSQEGAPVEPARRIPKLRVSGGPEALTRLNQVIDSRVGNGLLTRADLVNAGLVTPKQASRYSLADLVGALGGGDIRTRLDIVPGVGARVRGASEGGGSGVVNLPGAQPAAAEPAAPAETSAPVGESATPAGTPGVGVEVPVDAATGQPPAGAPPAAEPPVSKRPARRPLTRKQIQDQLDHPETGESLGSSAYETLQQIAQGRKTNIFRLTSKEVRDFLPGEEHADTRALLNHVLYQMKSGKKIADALNPGLLPQPSLTIPEREGNERVRAGLPRRPAERYDYPSQLARAENELAVTETALADDPENAQLAKRYEDLQEGVASAYSRGVHRRQMGADVEPEIAERGEMTMTDQEAAIPRFDRRTFGSYLPERVDKKTGAVETVRDMVREPAMKIFGKDELTPDEMTEALNLFDDRPDDVKAQERADFISQPWEQSPKFNAVQPAIDALTKVAGAPDFQNPMGRRGTYQEGSPLNRVQKKFPDYHDQIQDVVVDWLSRLGRSDNQILEKGLAARQALEAQEMARIEKYQTEGMGEEAVATLDELDRVLKRKEALTNRAYQNAVERRRLMMGPQTPETQAQLTNMLAAAVRNREKTYLERELKMYRQVDEARYQDIVNARSIEGMDPGDVERTALRPDTFLGYGYDDAGNLHIEPGKIGNAHRQPSNLDAQSRIALIRSSPEMLADLKGSALELTRQYFENKSRANMPRNQKAPYLEEMRKLASFIGVDPAQQFDRLVKKVGRAIQELEFGSEPQAATELLNQARVASSRDRYLDAEENSPTIGDSGLRVVDFEGKDPGLRQPVADALAPTQVPDLLARLTSELSSRVNLPTSFGGFSVTPELSGLRMDGERAYVNPLSARERAQSELSGTKLQGAQLADAINFKTAENIMETLTHEIAHQKARHDAATGDKHFLVSYGDAVQELGPIYQQSIRALQEALADAGPALDAPTKEHAARIAALKEAAVAAERAGESRDLAGAGEGGAAAAGNRPGGGARGAAGSGGVGRGPGGALPGGAGEEAARVGGAASAGRGAAAEYPEFGEPITGGEGAGLDGGDAGAREPGGPAGAGEGRGAGSSVEQPHASILPITPAARARVRISRGMDDLARGFANDFIRMQSIGHELNPEAADSVIADIEKAAQLPPEEIDKLVKAGPGHARDIGLNLEKVQGVSPEQKAGLALALRARNALYDRSRPLTVDDVNTEVQRLFAVHTPEEAIKIAQDNGLNNAVDMTFLRTVAATFMEDIDKARTRVRAAEIHNDPVAKEQAQDALSFATARKMAAIDTIIQNSTRVARTMRMMREMVSPATAGETFQSRFLGALKASRVPKEDRASLLKLFEDESAKGGAADWDSFWTKFREATKATKFDKFLEFWKAGLLGAPTQIANIGSNAVVLPYRHAENAGSILLENFYKTLTGKPKERHLSEITARLGGMTSSIGEAFSDLKSDLWDAITLQPPDIQKRVQRGSFFDDPDLRQVYGAISGKKGELIRIPFKSLDAFDNFFKTIARNQEWSVQADRIARKPETATRYGTTDLNELRAHVFSDMHKAAAKPLTNNDLYQHYKDAIEEGNRVAKEDFFQKPLPEAVRKFHEVTRVHPSLQLLFPFLKSPYNILGEGLKRTPLAAMKAIYDYKTGKIDDLGYIDATVKSAMGSTLLALFASQAMNGQVSGGGPSDPELQQQLKSTGWQPYSIKVGDSWYPYTRFEPFATVLGIGADLGEALKEGNLRTASDYVQKFIDSGSSIIMDKTGMTGLSSLINIIRDPNGKGKTAIKQLEASLVPNTVGFIPVAGAARAMDPYYRQTEAYTLDPIKAQIPGLSQTLDVQRDPTGAPRSRPGSPWERLISPFPGTEEQKTPAADAARELTRIRISAQPPAPYFKVGDSKVYYTPEEREAIGQAQQDALEEISYRIQDPDYQALPDLATIDDPNAVTKQTVLRSIISKYRTPVVQDMNRQAIEREQEG